MNFSTDSIDAIAGILGAQHERNSSESILSFGTSTGTASIVLTLTTLSDNTIIISAQTIHGYFELHSVSRYVPVEPDEVIFIAEEGERISGLVVGATGTCSLFANVHRSAMTADFGILEPALLLAAMQLGLAENITA